MSHNMTVTVDDALWREMKRHKEIRWSAVMKEAAREKLKALAVLERLMKKSEISEKDIEVAAVTLGKKITKRKSK